MWHFLCHKLTSFVHIYYSKFVVVFHYFFRTDALIKEEAMQSPGKERQMFSKELLLYYMHFI